MQVSAETMHDRTVVDVDPTHNSIVRRVMTDGVPTLPSLPAVKAVSWDGVLQDFSMARLTIDANELELSLEYPLGAAAPGRNDDEKPLVVLFVDGNKVTADTVYVVSTGMELGKQALRRCTLKAFEWTLQTTSTEPLVAWVGAAQCVVPQSVGNVQVAGHGRGGLWLRGRHSYFLGPAQEGARHAAFIVFATSRPSRSDIWDDLIALSFAIGSHIRVDQLVGLDSRGSTVEVIGRMSGTAPSARQSEHPPTGVSQSPHAPCWPAALFTKLSAYLERVSMIRTPLFYYVDAGNRAIIDLEALDLHTGLESFARWHLISIGKEEPNSSRRVERAFEELGRPLLTEQLKVLKKDRHKLVHEGLMNADGGLVFERDMTRLAHVRSALASLISLVIGYRGQLLGWGKATLGGEPLPPEWWPISAEDRREALTLYRVPDPFRPSPWHRYSTV